MSDIIDLDRYRAEGVVTDPSDPVSRILRSLLQVNDELMQDFAEELRALRADLKTQASQRRRRLKSVPRE
jgi:hypothetical protein